VPPDRVINLAVSGVTGRMGRILVERVASSPDLRLTGGIARRSLAGEAAQAHGCDRIERPATAELMLLSADALIDFSSADALAELLRTQSEALAGKALVIGTTGLTDEIETMIERCAERSPVLVAANFSVGVNVLLDLVERAAKALGPTEYDVEIVEAHHGRKADAPSGTALALGRAVAGGRSVQLDAVRRDGRSGKTGERPHGEIGLHALRGGSVVGEHRVLFLGQRERLELAHAASDRAVFADGALAAARWLVGREPGKYGMREVLGL
jgi:4-hydroxy-tetrahydrodipicolinate reductase